MKIRTTFFSALVALLTATPALAQRSDLTGYVGSIYVNGSSLQLGNLETTGPGNGYGVRLGYGVSEFGVASIEIGIADFPSGEDMPGGSYGLLHLDLSARYYFFSSASALRPYLGAQMGVHGLEAKYEIEGYETDSAAYSGKSYGILAGAQYFFTPSLSVDLGAVTGAGSFEYGSVGDGPSQYLHDDTFGSIVSRVLLGVAFHR